ncbi:MAG: response regulator [Candidatus Saccharibacteria bacterium]
MDKKLILVVEDEDSLSTVIKYELENAGYDVLVESNGSNVMNLMKSKKPALVLLDIMIPGLSGLDILQAAMADPDTKEAKIVVVTTLNSADRQQEYKTFGAAGFIDKVNMNLPDILKKIREVMVTKPSTDIS